jgi:hypothetical protein
MMLPEHVVVPTAKAQYYGDCCPIVYLAHLFASAFRTDIVGTVMMVARPKIQMTMQILPVEGYPCLSGICARLSHYPLGTPKDNEWIDRWIDRSLAALSTIL